jgi:homoserine O-acetyltransferase
MAAVEGPLEETLEQFTPPSEVAAAGEYDVLELGDLALQHGGTLAGARLAYKVYGSLRQDRSNAILFPSWYTGTHVDLQWLIGPAKPLDTTRYCVICPNLFSMGLSSSPSNTPRPQNGASFPDVSILDNVVAQHRLVTEVLGIEELQLVLGGSMGAEQAFQWAVSHPDMVRRVLPFQGSARTSEHNRVFLEALRGAVELDPEWRRGRYDRNPEGAMRLFGRIYAGWGLSQQFYWQRLYLDAGFTSLDDFLVRFWEGMFLARDANDLVAQLWTWYEHDVGLTPGFDGDCEAALRSIRAQAIVMPAEKDLYFPPEDQAYEVSHMPNAELRVVPSPWGHSVCVGADPEAGRLIGEAVRELLAREA